MTFSTDPFLGRVYHPTAYNCLHFTRDVWLELTGEDIGDRLTAGLEPYDRGSSPVARGLAMANGLRQFQRLAAPEDPCLALMMRARLAPHIGVYLDRRVLHIHERGVEFQPPEIARRGFTSMGYYR